MISRSVTRTSLNQTEFSRHQAQTNCEKAHFVGMRAFWAARGGNVSQSVTHRGKHLEVRVRCVLFVLQKRV